MPAAKATARPSTRAATPSMGLWLGLALLVIVADQLTKTLVVARFALGDSVTITSYFNLVRAHNPGAAFSFLADAGGWQRFALTVVGVVVSVVLAVLLWRGVGSRLETAANVGLIGGALGNVADRLRIGTVVDYLDLHWRGMHWAAFNLADILVVGGAALLLLVSSGTAPVVRNKDREGTA